MWVMETEAEGEGCLLNAYLGLLLGRGWYLFRNVRINGEGICLESRGIMMMPPGMAIAPLSPLLCNQSSSYWQSI